MIVSGVLGVWGGGGVMCISIRILAWTACHPFISSLHAGYEASRPNHSRQYMYTDRLSRFEYIIYKISHRWVIIDRVLYSRLGKESFFITEINRKDLFFITI